MDAYARLTYDEEMKLLWLAAAADVHQWQSETELIHALEMLLPEDREAVRTFVKGRPRRLDRE